MDSEKRERDSGPIVDRSKGRKSGEDTPNEEEEARVLAEEAVKGERERNQKAMRNDVNYGEEEKA